MHPVDSRLDRSFEKSNFCDVDYMDYVTSNRVLASTTPSFPGEKDLTLHVITNEQHPAHLLLSRFLGCDGALSHHYICNPPA